MTNVNYLCVFIHNGKLATEHLLCLCSHKPDPTTHWFFDMQSMICCNHNDCIPSEWIKTTEKNEEKTRLVQRARTDSTAAKQRRWKKYIGPTMYCFYQCTHNHELSHCFSKFLNVSFPVKNWNLRISFLVIATSVKCYWSTYMAGYCVEQIGCFWYFLIIFQLFCFLNTFPCDPDDK